LDYEFIPLIFKNLPLIFSIFGVFLALNLNKWLLSVNQVVNYLSIWLFNPKKKQLIYSNNLIKVIWFLNNKWYFDYIYNYFIGFSILKHGYETFYKLIDKGFIEICGVQGLSIITYKISVLLSRKQAGYIYHSAALLSLSFIYLLCILLAI
jgi:hypothetical protein